MMDWGDGGWGWGAWIAMVTFMVAFWGVIAWVVLSVARGRARSNGSDQTAEEILAARFAAGEIDEDEYNRRRETLRSQR